MVTPAPPVLSELCQNTLIEAGALSAEKLGGGEGGATQPKATILIDGEAQANVVVVEVVPA